MHAERARDAGRDLRGTRRREPEPLACARLRRDGPERPVRAAHAGGVLLQDLHVAAFGLASLVRACHTPRSRTRSRTVCAGPRSLRPAVRTLRRARGRRRPGGPRCRARGVSVRRTGHALRRAARTRWLAARRARRDDRRPAGATMALRCDRDARSASERDAAEPHDGLRLLPAQPGRSLRAPHGPSGGAPGRHTARAPLAGPGPRGRACDRRGRAAARIPGQRPPGRHARVRRLDVSAPLRRQRRLAHRRRDGLRCGLRDRARPARGRARRLRSSPTCATPRPVPGRRRRARRGSRSSTARPSWGRRVGWACAASTLGTPCRWNDRSTAARSPAMRCSCPAATRRACISSRSRAASSRGTRVARRSCPTGHAERERSAGACRGVDGLESVLNDGAQAGVAAARAAGRDAEWRPIRAASRDFSVLGAPGALRQGARAGAVTCVRRLSERRHDEGSRAGRARGLRVDRAHQALHDDRHGDRPGQDVEHERARDRGRRPRAPAAGRRPDHVPDAVHARDVRHARRL